MKLYILKNVWISAVIILHVFKTIFCKLIVCKHYENKYFYKRKFVLYVFEKEM